MQGLSPPTVTVRPTASAVTRHSKGWIAVAILAALIYFIRDRYQFLNPQLWAEDATVFLAMSVREALFNFIQPYAGYFHFAPRAIALLAAFFPTSLAPVVFFYGAVVAAIASCVSIYLMVETLPTHLRFLFALAPLLVLPGGEVYGTVTNIQWFLGAAFGVLLLTYRSDTFRSRAWLVMAAILGLTGPFSVAFWPGLVIWCVFTRRVRLNRAMLITVGIAALIQCAAIVLVGVNKYGVGIAGAPAWVRAVEIFAGSFVTLNGFKGGVAMLGVALLVAAGFHHHRQTLRSGYLPLGLVGLSALTLAMGLWTHKHMPDEINPLGPAERYYFLPFIFLFMAVIASADSARRKYAGLCLLIALLLLFGWTRHFRKVELSDFRWRDYYALSRVTPDSLVPIQPGWVVRLTNDAPERTVVPVPVDMSGLVLSDGVLHNESGETTLVADASVSEADPQIRLSVPPSCATASYRFIRVAAQDGVRVQLHLSDADGISAQSASQNWHIGAGDHWYFDLPRSTDVRSVRLEFDNDLDDTTRGLRLSWVCWS